MYPKDSQYNIHNTVAFCKHWKSVKIEVTEILDARKCYNK